MEIRHPLSLIAALALLSGSCSLVLHFDPDLLLENNADRCSDGVDNDDNGLTDCAEPDCQIFEFCQETSEEACRDRLDNDRDGLVDCADADCLVYDRCTESGDGKCVDGADNNGDLLRDCQDFTCMNEPVCCTLVTQLFAPSLSAAPGGCTPAACDPAQSGETCAAFDPAHWRSVGAPAPAVAPTGGLDPNRCDICYLSGNCGPCGDAVLLSADTFPFRTGLQIGAQLHQAPGQHVRAGVALTWQTSFDVALPCADDAPLDRVAAVELTPDASGVSVVTMYVDGVAEASQIWPTDSVAAFVRMDDQGFARFYLRPTLAELPTGDEVEDHRSDRALPVSTSQVRLAVYGGGAGLRVSEAGVWNTARCFDPVPSPTGGAMTFSNGVALTGGATGMWNGDMVESPTVVHFEGEDHMYYTGRRSAEGGLGAIGHAVLVGDGTQVYWVNDVPNLPVLTAAEVYRDWDPDQTELYGPSAVVLPDGALALYFTVARRSGESILWTAIDGMKSYDGVTFEPLRSGESEDVLLPPVTQTSNPDSWEHAVRDPTVVWRYAEGTPQFTMLYTARSESENPFSAQIGLATSSDGIVWQRANRVNPCPQSGCNQPVVSPPPDALVHTAVSDPTVAWDPALQLFRLWYVWRVGQEFSLFHAAAPADARHWVLFPGNPVLRSGDLPWCDDQYLDGPSVRLDDSGRLQVWYHGYGLNDRHSICYAENVIHP